MQRAKPSVVAFEHSAEPQQSKELEQNAQTPEQPPPPPLPQAAKGTTSRATANKAARMRMEFLPGKTRRCA